ncbi:hypothetical protein IV79_GL000578 [Pediococcus claussenii]|nr:hypothetical protein IV79_GL000578 [Pediococcus claussenii]
MNITTTTTRITLIGRLIINIAVKITGKLIRNQATLIVNKVQIQFPTSIKICFPLVISLPQII